MSLGGLKLKVRRHLRRLYGARLKRRVASHGTYIRANRRTRLTSQTHLGNNVHFNGLVIAGNGQVRIGDNFHSGPGCLLISQDHNFDKGASLPYDQTYTLRPITIEDNVWLGSRVIILGGVRIGEGAIVQAGAVVVRDVPSCSIVGGNPAEVFKYRDIEHYERLKAANRFG